MTPCSFRMDLAYKEGIVMRVTAYVCTLLLSVPAVAFAQGGVD